MEPLYKIAGIDVHKKMLAVVVINVAELREDRFERRRFGTGESELKLLADWLMDEGVCEAVMESTAQYWKPVWQKLEGHCELHLAQAQSNRAPKGRKTDFADAERLVRRFVADELILSFVPNSEQRLWRTLTRSKHQLVRDRVRLQNQLESFLEDCRIKLSSHVSDLLGVSSRKMLRALAEGESDAGAIAALASSGLRATQAELADALVAAGHLDAIRRQILQLFLDRLDVLNDQMDRLAKMAATAMSEHQEAVKRLAEVPGLGADSAQQIVAEVGPAAAKFSSPESLSSWVGCCPGREESAAVSKSNSSPKGNRTMRRVLNQAANAAVRSKGCIFQLLYRRLVSRIGHSKAIWAVAHKLCRVTWKILHDRASYLELGQEPDPRKRLQRANKLIRQLRRLGCHLEVQLPTSLAPEA